MAIKQSDLVEIVAELCRFIMFTGLFFWLLSNGATFAHDIIASLWQVGGDAAGGGQAIYPGRLINLGMQIYQQTLTHVNWLQPESIVAPIIIAVIILIVCALIAVNMMLLLCAAWIVLYAGLIFLGFGGCRWTSDMAINYYRTVLGVGVSLMTMQLIIGIGVQFLQDLVTSTSQTLDASQLGILLCAVIILAVISHRLPHMVAGMVVGGGHNGAIGGVGIMTLLGALLAGASMAGRAAANPATAAATEATGQAAKMLEERIANAEAAVSAQRGAGSALASEAGGDEGSGVVPPVKIAWPGGSSRSGGAASRPSAGGETGGATRTGTGRQSAPKPTAGGGSGAALGDDGQAAGPAEPPLERPMSGDEARGFGPDGNGGEEGQPYSRSDDQVT
jgi:P-type conjugative transfer protein TrbL